MGTGEQEGREGQVIGKVREGVTAGRERVAGSEMRAELVCGWEKQQTRE